MAYTANMVEIYSHFNMTKPLYLLRTIINMRCDNLIAGMALWNKYLFACVLVATVVFEILSLWSHALHEKMVPLPETLFKIVFQNTPQ
jgi:hypothetical protein